MATVQKKKTAKKEAPKSKAVEPDYTALLDCGATVDIYCHDDDNVTCKITLYNAFVIFGKVINYEDKYFISYPSYYSKKKKSYINQAYCFDVDINKEISDFLNAIF